MDTKFVIGIDLYDPLGESGLVDFGFGDDVEVVATAFMGVEIKLLENAFVPSSGYGGPRSPQGPRGYGCQCRIGS